MYKGDTPGCLRHTGDTRQGVKENKRDARKEITEGEKKYEVGALTRSTVGLGPGLTTTKNAINNR